MIVETLLRLGIPTLEQCIYTTTSAEKSITIAKKLPANCGRIYGISVDADGVKPDDSAVNLVTAANCLNLYINLVAGTTVFLQDKRLDMLAFSKSGSSFDNPARWYPVNIPGEFDLDKSVYKNPTTIATGAVIKLNLLYITKKAYAYLVEKKIVGAVEWMGLEP